MKLVKLKMRSMTAMLLAVMIVLPIVFGQAQNVYAADTVTLYHDTQYHYGNWSTGNLSVDDGAGTAFCVQPSKDTPPNGSYPYELMSHNSNMRKALYYLVGGNGYEDVTSKTLFSDYDYIDIYVTSHVMLSWIWDGCKWSGDADEGIGSEFKAQIESLYDEIMNLPDPPDAFETFIVEGDDVYQTVVGSWPLQDIDVSLQKRSSIPAFTENNPCYSLKGAVYEIYQSENDAKSDTNAIAGLTVKEDGTSNVISLKPGTYYYKETKSGNGYAIDPEVHAVEITSSDSMTQTIMAEDTPQYNPIDLLMIKKYKDGKEGNTTGDAVLSGAEFTVKYYGSAKATGDAKYTWIFQTDESGKVCYKDSYKKSGPKLIVDASGNPVLPLGTVTIQETKAPAGYLLNDTVYTIPIKSEGEAETVSTYQSPVIEEDVIRGGVAFDKQDKELSKNEGMGGASLSDITFALCNESEHAVLVEEKVYEKGDVIDQLITDESGHIETEQDMLPYGTYSLQEIKTNDSYLLSDGQKHYFRIRENNVIVSTDRDQNPLVFPNQVVRNDISFHKIEDSTNKRMGMVAFLLTQNETGEQHVIVTNKNGYFSSLKRHTEDTNINDTVLKEYEQGAVIPTNALHPNTGLWFGQGRDGSESKPDDSLGALPYGSYTLSELRCEANDGYELLTNITFYIEEDKAETPVISLGTLTNDRTQTPEIHTVAESKENGTHYVSAEKKVSVTDTVIYSGLKPGQTYKIQGVAKDPETGEDILDDQNHPIISETEYTPDSSNGKVALLFQFDAEKLAGKQIVFTEKVLLNEKEVAVHADLKDEAQTIYVVKIGTKAKDADNETHVSNADDEVTIRDEVMFDGLKVNTEYTIEGVLMDRSTGKPLLIDGKNVTSKKEITPTEPKGTVELSFALNGSSLAGHDIVVFETVKEQDVPIASHEDLTNEDQTIHFPELQTTVDDQGTDSKKGERIITDTVSYSNLIPGEKYIIKGTLMDKATGKPVCVQNSDVTGIVEFTPERSNGKIEVSFRFDVTAYYDRELVAFEQLYLDEVKEKSLIASHEDLEDEKQTVLIKCPSPAGQSITKTKVEQSQTIVTKGPKTGDSKKMIALILIGVAACGALVLTLLKRNQYSV